MALLFSTGVSKPEVFNQVRNELAKHNLSIVNEEFRPWGGFFVIHENEAERFLDVFFASLNKNELLADNKLSPKILIVEGGKRLSWQYHHRRAELWKVIGGIAGVIKSDNDEQNNVEKYNVEDIIKLKKGERHRLVGLDTWGIIAEIWQHTDVENPSDEDDIIRLDDDFGR